MIVGGLGLKLSSMVVGGLGLKLGSMVVGGLGLKLGSMVVGGLGLKEVLTRTLDAAASEFRRRRNLLGYQKFLILFSERSLPNRFSTTGIKFIQ
jgi:hypothetical protein